MLLRGQLLYNTWYIFFNCFRTRYCAGMAEIDARSMNPVLLRGIPNEEKNHDS